MPSIMWVWKEISLPSLGSRVIAPMTGSNGQHPSKTLTSTSSIRAATSPTFVIVNA